MNFYEGFTKNYLSSRKDLVNRIDCSGTQSMIDILI